MASTISKSRQMHRIGLGSMKLIQLLFPRDISDMRNMFLTRNAHKACPDGIPLPEWILKSRETGDVDTFPVNL
ncbi:unnamed protein product [Prunus armeniaca]|uniref:Uncharacterized protein n=1 Tax=Prunus armeniaca TaxID=36596 RepID=A0A6J5WHP4_PRUAR|nr:unnamed protein product [Prunus armeniaca]CAB4301236.1 unnamed protein product [Prunus armeniaca]